VLSVDAELDLVDTALWYTKMARKDYTVGAVPIESGVDDPDQMFYELRVRRLTEL
jgi:peptide/nickel transport system substrate-binding protein